MNRRSGSSLVRAKSCMVAVIFASLTIGVLADETKLDTQSYLIPSSDPGVDLYVRSKHPAGMTNFSADKTLLFVHGATYPRMSLSLLK
jgi:hypothetical protein